jgi:hypothetical protein
LHGTLDKLGGDQERIDEVLDLDGKDVLVILYDLPAGEL